VPTENGIDVRIVQLHDVNRFGHAVGVIRQVVYDDDKVPIPELSKFYACVLTAAADFNEDLKVDGTDLGILLGDWNKTASIANLNCDCVVDGLDFGILLGMWSVPPDLAYVSLPSPASAGGCCSGIGLQGASAADQGEAGSWDAESAVSELGFTSLDGFSAWLQIASEDEIGSVISALKASFESAVGGGS